MLTLHNVTKSFSAGAVLQDISLKVEPNSIVGLAGPSGSGKSTLLRCIAELESIDGGKIEGHNNSGFMFQDFQLFPHMNVLKNLTYASSLQDKKQDHQKHAMETLAKLGIEDKASTFPIQLSGGQKQRVALARSLMMQPELLLCDEPTSGLDVATIDDVVTLLASVRDMGVTMVIASHDLDFLTKVADRIVLLKSGSIAVDMEPRSFDDPIHHLKQYY